MSKAFNESLLRRARSLGSATLHEAYGKQGALSSSIKPLRSDWRVAGPVFTVSGAPRDNLRLHQAIYGAPIGSVLLHRCDGDAEAGYWGGIMTNAARTRGLLGYVSEGGVRDTLELCDLNWPVFAANACIRGTSKRTDAWGALGIELKMGDTTIWPGDLLVGDADGVVVIAADEAERVVEAGEAREASERAIIDRITRGESTLAIYKLPDYKGR